MNRCSNCQNKNIKQISSFHTRLLLSIYLFLNFYFFTGAIDYGALIAIIPVFIPYSYKCSNCNKRFFGLDGPDGVPLGNRGAHFIPISFTGSAWHRLHIAAA